LSAVALIGAMGIAHDIARAALETAGCTVVEQTSPELSDDVVIVVVEPSSSDWRELAACANPVVVVLDRPSPTKTLDAFIDGASAVVTADDEPAALVRAVALAEAGELQMPRRLTRAALDRAVERASSGAGPVLTAREIEILDSIERGESLKQTARRLGIKNKTVQNLQTRLFRKLGATNRSHCVTRAHELGLVPSE